jgi:lysophospholipase L1-like esterase
MVLFVGGSAAWGYGASTNADIVHEKISALLNSAQTDVRYTVINLAMRGWIAQQEAVALDLWGRLYDPDWVVTMDGSNDSTAGCRFSQGTGNPTLTPIMRIQLRPDYFYAINRNGSEERLIEVSALYRALTGKRPVKTAGRRYITEDIFFDPSMQMGEFAFTSTPFSEVKNQLEFYLLAEKSIIDRFPRAKYLLTTEARAEPFKSMFGDYFDTGVARSEQTMREQKFTAVMDAWLKGSEAIGRECSHKNGTVAQRYILEMGALRLKQLVEQTASAGRPEVEYFNMGLLFPLPLEQRRNFFIDDVHLNDAGHDRLAHYYAYRILTRDFPDRDWTSLRPDGYRSPATQ